MVFDAAGGVVISASERVSPKIQTHTRGQAAGGSGLSGLPVWVTLLSGCFKHVPADGGLSRSGSGSILPSSFSLYIHVHRTIFRD